jgi:hypothetical protein
MPKAGDRNAARAGWVSDAARLSRGARPATPPLVDDAQTLVVEAALSQAEQRAWGAVEL